MILIIMLLVTFLQSTKSLLIRSYNDENDKDKDIDGENEEVNE